MSRRTDVSIVHDVVVSVVGDRVHLADRWTRAEPQFTPEDADLLADALRDGAALARKNREPKRKR